jgi:hypothetical protein
MTHLRKFFEFSLFTCTCTRAVLDGDFVSEISIIKGNLQECGATMQVIQQMKRHLIFLPREIVLFSRGSRPMFPETKLRETLRVEGNIESRGETKLFPEGTDIKCFVI